jgi:hypothetical protein
MPQTALIGVEPQELPWLRLLLFLLRHPEPGIPELARQALIYLQDAAARPVAGKNGTEPR